jgi:hypothetical protein
MLITRWVWMLGQGVEETLMLNRCLRYLATISCLPILAGIVINPDLRADVTWHLPFKSDDLSSNEYYSRNKSTHGGDSQKFGFDLGARRYDDQGDFWTSITVDWTTHDASPRNDYYVVYGKRVYAMQSGKIIRCWRNAPENPRPAKSTEGFGNGDENFLHQWSQDQLIPGGGNQLIIEGSDGTNTLYAHFQTGSIPSSLCPINKSRFDKPDTSTLETTLAESDQVNVKRGQFLGVVGNAGNSTGPHLHTHVTQGGNAEVLNFSHGLASKLDSNARADVSKWTKFKGKSIPPGPTLIWPPRKLTAEIARHGMPADQFQLQFMHLSDSGFQPTWLDVFSAGNRNYINMVWRPATDGWRAWAGISGKKFQQVFDQAKKDKYYPVLTDVGLWGGKPRYAAIFHKNEPGEFAMRFGILDKEATLEFNSNKTKGLAPVSASVVSVGGKRRHTVLYRKSNVGSWWIKSRIATKDYQSAYNENTKAGRLPRHLDVYRHDGTTWFAAVFTSRPEGAVRAGHGLSDSGYQKEFNTSVGNGYSTQAVAGYDGASERIFAAAWLKMPAARTASLAPAKADRVAQPTAARSSTSSSVAASNTTISGRAIKQRGAAPVDDSSEQGADVYSKERVSRSVSSVKFKQGK